MPRGGRREGSGHPTKAAAQAKRAASADAIARFEAAVEAEGNEIVRALFDLGKGAYYEGCGGCEKPRDKCRCAMPLPVRIYQRLPDRAACVALLEHMKGRAAQAQVVRAETEIILECAVPRPPLPARMVKGNAE